ncbi:uncharacterized protein LOC123695304 isoform X1 [Colias croceus]|uniref:uncharacterized protein LOC123695304 isoform X1 n=1 Tax=Colias crocea TaxID=72248 RepID=UPI001E27BE6C|nr:uncharacterized protein LOC123695304 isoform X1 [Colias croceus]
MSFVDLATLAMHRRQEMEARIQVFLEKCDHAIHDINKLKVQAQGFVEQLNCEPSELKERFLNCMQHLDEYTYLITDFNLAVGKLDETSSTDLTPVLDTSKKLLPSPATFNLMDTLSEPTPSTSTACPNLCPVEKPKKKKKPKDEDLLISFSSVSCSTESVPIGNDSVEKEVLKVQTDLENTKLDESATNAIDSCNLPAQTLLQVDEVYQGSIVHIDGLTLWVITGSIDDVYNLMTDMTEYYKVNKVELSLEQIKSLIYCAVYEEKTEAFYRGLFIRISEDDTNIAEVYLVDTGETRLVPICSLQPLLSLFCDKPPMARCCHLAGVDLLDCNNQELLKRQEVFMEVFIGQACSIVIDDNTSESLGVYVVLQSKNTLNDLVVENGFAVKIENSTTKNTDPSKAAADIMSDADLDITQCPEYEDPVEAVTGYHNRDEADICAHYKGGTEKTCFKGARCKKRHVQKHPDGWTLDRVAVAGKVRALALPAPGTWLRVRVTWVVHYDHFYVHLPTDTRPESLPNFGVVLPPTTLDALVRDMNSPATKLAYKPLKTTPAPGELVAALYPLDDHWYRARVISATRTDQCVQVMYLDYGTVVWVKEDAVRVLEPRFVALPAQAVRCMLAGVAVRSAAPAALSAARHALSALLLDRTLDAHVLARTYDEITVELFDENGYSIAETLAQQKVVELREFEMEDDKGVQQKIVVP